MTIADRDPRPGGEHRRIASSSHGRRTARDLERYAGLFAARTKVMRSSAMRDLMALTERKDVISLAGGLPDTASFPAKSFAAIMSRVAVDSCARSLQYGPTEGLTVLKSCIAEVMAEEGTIVDPDVGRRQRAGDESGQERADARSAGQTGALENVDQQSQSVR